MHYRVRIATLLSALLVMQVTLSHAGEPPAPVGQVALQVVATPSAGRTLDVGLALFDPGIPEDKSLHSKQGIFPEIRKSETRFTAVILRRTLVESNAWGVVRVLPEPDPTSELSVTGKILRSDGRELHVSLEARDATGRVWLSREYRDVAGEGDYPVQQDDDPFRDLYRAVANDLLEVLQDLDDRELLAIGEVARLRYAATLSPEAFAGYLEQDDTGIYQLLRLPADDDPMMDRVRRIRNQEYLFIDTLDESYSDLYQEMSPTYNLWRQYRREQAVFREEYQQRVADRDSRGRRGSFAAMSQTYEAYKWSKIHEQDLDELAQGFNNEVQPTVLEVRGKVFRLTGTLDTQYQEWRVILRDIFALETGLLPAPVEESLDHGALP